MRTLPRLLLLLLPLLWLVFYLKSIGPLAKYRPAPQPHIEVPDEPIKAATPEDPGPTATVVSPLKSLEKTLPYSQPEPQKPVASTKADHTDAGKLPPPNHFLHKQFVVGERSEFAFTVPPNIVNPALRGHFRSFANDSPDGVGRPSADVDLALMSDAQYTDFVRGRRFDAEYENTSHGQAVQLAIPPTHGELEHYHLVFLPEQRSRNVVVDADFTVSFQ